MKRTDWWLMAVAGLALLTASCTGSSDAAIVDGAVETATMVEAPTEVPTEEAVLEPTTVPTAPPTAAPALSDDDKIMAAIAAFEAAPRPVDLMAWDHLGAEVLGDSVTLEVCGWTGETVFDAVYTINYLVTEDDAGEPLVDFVFDSQLPRDCLNTELIESALAATRAYDLYWNAVLTDPTTFDSDVAVEFDTPGLIEIGQELVDGWVRDGVHWRGTGLDAQLPDSAITDVLWRRYDLEEEDVGQPEALDLLVCRQLDPSYGLYRDSALVDDFKRGSTGTHVIEKYILRRGDDRWLMIGVTTNAWADCLIEPPSWVDQVNQWQPDPVAWQALPDV